MEWVSNFHAENSCDLRQLETEVKNEVAYKKKHVSGKFFKMSTGTENGQFGFGCGHKTQSKILLWPNKWFAIDPCKY